MRRPDLTARPWFVRHPDGSKLAGPRMHPQTPPAVRVLVFQYVLTKQYGMALLLADNARDVIERSRKTDELLGLLSEDPYRRYAA